MKTSQRKRALTVKVSIVLVKLLFHLCALVSPGSPCEMYLMYFLGGGRVVIKVKTSLKTTALQQAWRLKDLEGARQPV